MKNGIRIGLTLALGAGLALGQKPKSPKETEALVAIQNAATPDARIAAIESLLTNFADTEYKSVVLIMAMEAARQQGNYEKTTLYADRALEADPNAYYAEIVLAGEIARHTREFDLDKTEKLAKAEKYANTALDQIQKASKPNATMTDDQWAVAKKDYTAQAHDSLGLIAMDRKKYDVAVTEFKTSVATSGTPDPTTSVRLAEAYRFAGKNDEAIATYDGVLAMPNLNPQVKQVAEARRADLIKTKAPAAAPKP